jgi:sugar/nucleoside kinase (ribokinase family)
MSLLVVGSVAFDAIETPFGKTERTLGGAATYFSLAAALLSPVRLVGVVGEDFSASDEAVFRGRKIDLAGLERASGKSLFWAGRYSSDLRSRETLRTDLNVFAAFAPKLPEAYRDSPFVFLGNIDPALQRNVLKQMRRRPKLVALDTMNYWISRTRKELGKTLKLIDALLINDEEACQLVEESNLLRAARKILRMGPKALVIKRGEHGSMMFHGDSILAVPAYPRKRESRPTAACDALWLGAGQLCRRATGSRALAHAEAPRSGSARSRAGANDARSDLTAAEAASAGHAQSRDTLP